MWLMQHEAYSIISEIFQPKMFNLIPIKRLDFTAKLQETNYKEAVREIEKVGCSARQLPCSRQPVSAIQKRKDRPWEI